MAGVRESLAALEAAGLIVVRHGHGTFVRERPPLQQALAGWLSFGADPNELRGLNEARRVLEDALVRLAAERASPAEQDRDPGGLSTRWPTAIDDAEGFVDADARFHLAVAEAAHNPVLLRLMNALAHRAARAVPPARRAEPGRGAESRGSPSSATAAWPERSRPATSRRRAPAMAAILDLAAAFARARARRQAAGPGAEAAVP